MPGLAQFFGIDLTETANVFGVKQSAIRTLVVAVVGRHRPQNKKPLISLSICLALVAERFANIGRVQNIYTRDFYVTAARQGDERRGGLS